MIIGLAGGVVCYLAVALKPKLKYDDSLDAFGVHGVGGFLGAVLTGVFASAAVFKAGSGSDIASDLMKSVTPDRLGQIGVQCAAAAVAALYAFGMTAILVKAIDALVGFTLDAETETAGLDRGIHGEVGFDLDVVGEAAAEPVAEPRAANVPPDGKLRFTLVVDGPTNGDLVRAWADLCQREPTQDFRAVYPYLTTVQGNRFRFRGGDPEVLQPQLERLVRERLPAARFSMHVEP
jgi:hypothetical protein